MGFFTQDELGVGVPRITDYSEKWQDHSGAQVEDFITRRLVKEMTYDGGTNELVLLNADSEPIASTVVSVATPNYSHTISIERIYIDNIDVTNEPKIQCKLGQKVELGIRYNLVASNPLTGTSNHITGKQNLSIKIGNTGYIKLDQGITSSDELQRLDITSLFTNTTVSTISLRVVTYTGVPEEIKVVTATTNKTIAVLNPKIKYVGNNYIINGTASFQVIDGGQDVSYALRYTLNNGTLTRSTSFNVDIAQSGMNELEVYAVVADNETLKSESIRVQVINIKSQDTFDSLQYAINEIASEVTNWEYSKMYRVSLYTKGYSEDLITIETYLTNTADEGDTYFDKIKQLETQLINSKETNPYMYEEDICYFFGENDLTSDITAGLVVKINGEDAIAFDDYIQMEISTDTAFTYTEGASFYYDQFDPDNSNIVTSEVLANIESPDGIVQEDSLTVFRVSANEYEEPILKQDLSSTLTNAGFTFELDFKSYNISDPNKPVLKLGRFILYPTEVNWIFNESDVTTDRNSRSALFQEGERTHVVIQIAPNFSAPLREIPSEAMAAANKTINVVRVFINGVVDREYTYSTLSDFNLNGFNLEIAPEASDIDIYDLRIYNRALSLEEISNNYISTMSNIEEKKFFQTANAITAVDTNNDTYISYNLAKNLYNTLIYVMPKGKSYIHQFNAIKDTKIQDCTVFVNYVNNVKLPTQLTAEQISRSSGRFTGVELKGQGTSAMKYYWWNISMKGKFTSQGCYDQIEQIYVEPEGDTNLLYNSKYYYMPTDPNIGIKKIVGKTNYASSMQSHKIGATKAFHDLWNICVDKSQYSELDIMGRKAVLEEPFLVFYIDSDIESTYNKENNPDADGSPMKEITPEYIESLNDQDIKFAGFQTWGSGKGDDATSGYDEDLTPGYLMLEGAENSGKLANFLTPWMPDCIELSGETYKTLGVTKDTDSDAGYSYGAFDSLDVDYGLAEDSETELCEAAKKTMEKFIEAYNFVYMHTINLEPYTGTISLNDASNKSVLDVTKKYYITNSKYSDSTGFAGYQWDVFRYDQYSDMWVPAGLPRLDSNGKQIKHSTIVSPYDSPVYDYEVFNLKSFYKANGGTGVENFANFRQLIIDKFKEGFGNYFHVDDIVFHQAFIKLFAGTDNRAKNTYFKLIDENSKITLLQDDLDTILATDNRGLQKKPYFLLEPSQETAINPENGESYGAMWGGNSAFFDVFDVAYKREIDEMLKSILEQFEINQAPSLHNWMYKYFYYVQEYFPATAYNHTARLCYESAQVFYENRTAIGTSWDNNGQPPITQVHGSCLQSEKEFMKKRLVMFLSQAQISGMFGKDSAGINIKSSEDSSFTGSFTIDITPYQYLYLGYNSGSNPILYSSERKAAGESSTITISLDSTTAQYSVLGSGYISRFDNFGKIPKTGGEYTLSESRLTEVSAYAEDPVFLPSVLNLKTPVLTKLDLTGVSSLTTINLDSDHTPKLQEVYLTGTNITNVNLPTGSRLKTVHFPATLQNLYIYNNPGLVDVQFEGLSNLKTVYIDCAKCGEFDVNAFCEQLLDVQTLESLTLRNASLLLTEEALLKLITIPNNNIQGTITVIDENQELKDINFSTKQQLVSKYGNINTGSKGLIINYQPSNIIELNVTCDSEISIFKSQLESYPIERPNMFNLVITSGNNVNIINDRLDISYTMSNISSTIATISQDGTITMFQETTNTSQYGIVTITIKTSTDTITKKCNVYFKWKAPALGDFAYADGSFSSSYNPNKTMIGLVFATTDPTGVLEEGTVYIIGKEYSGKEQYLGYSTDGNSQASDTEITKDIYRVQEYLNGLGISSYGTIDTNVFPDNVPTEEINISTYTDFSNDYFNGKKDLAKYIKAVSPVLSKLLSKNSNVLSSYIKANNITIDDNIETCYMPTSKSSFDYLCSTYLPKQITTLSNTPDITTSILYPYFYQVYFYEPVINENEVLDEQYKQGNWYVPSVAEMARAIYYRGYSAGGSTFTSGESGMVQQTINDNLSKGTTIQTTPIFSMAKKAMGIDVSCWASLVQPKFNATSTEYSSEQENYSYQKFVGNDWVGGNYTEKTSYKWAYGSPNEGDYSNDSYGIVKQIWRFTKQQCIPFVQYEYSKPV